MPIEYTFMNYEFLFYKLQKGSFETLASTIEFCQHNLQYQSRSKFQNSSYQTLRSCDKKT